MGLEGFHSEAYPLWASFGPQIYVAARMLYNPALDCDALLKGFFADLYGPAAPEMAALYQTFEDAWMSYRRPGRWFEGISSMSEQISMYRPEHLTAVRRTCAAPGSSRTATSSGSVSPMWTRGWPTR